MSNDEVISRTRRRTERARMCLWAMRGRARVTVTDGDDENKNKSSLLPNTQWSAATPILLSAPLVTYRGAH